MGEEDDQQSPMLKSISSAGASQEPPKRTGTQLTAVAHIIAGVIGAGVLSLAWSVAQLGWILGPVCMICFAGIAVISTFVLCDCYRYPDPEYGTTRNRSFMEAVKFYFGEKQQHICGVFAHEGLYGTGIAYTITAAASVRAILRSNCYHQGGYNAPCQYEDSFYMLLFGVVEILLSQIPDFHSIGWLSIIAAAMSFSYAFIGSGLGFLKVLENGTIKGSITGVPASSNLNKLWLAFEALADVAFAYPYTLIVLEIQDTLKSPPPENQTMKAASLKAIVITTFFYLCCGCFGYAAFGDSTPGNLLTGFGFYEPYWLVDLANACIVLHLVGAYQIYSQPVFATAERWFTYRFPDSGFLNNSISFKIPLCRAFQLNPFRVVFRTTYVVSTTALAMSFPYFNSVLGVLGALNFWPLAVYFPVEMYLKQKKIRAWSREWICYRAYSCLCLLVTVVGFIGSLEELVGARLAEKIT
ncbi:probable amino acid permease 7 isoform X1 [Syzygium oleosum]|uniref:probable amino acid permease 7 isoform X1 n=1 Tax=Syzygium oleosum TaxID=219896 RepID=UPI0011D2A4B6|nr:probable amino acid permease 7 isoform X1 [Syzygium oleosum]